MNIKFVIFFVVLKPGWMYFDEETNLPCLGKKYENVTLAAYYPIYQDDYSFQDIKDKKLRSLQEYLDNQCRFITLAMDEKLGIPYGTKVCIPELNEHFGHPLQFEVRDSGSDLTGMGYLRADIFVRTEMDSYDSIVNRRATLVFQK